VRATARDAALTDALAVLARTRVLRHAGLGDAFLTLARRDTAAAAARFAMLADSVPDAAPVLLAVAARLATASGDSKRAVRYWEQVVTHHASAAEAPEALLELARALVRAGDTAGATARYESLIIDHAGSAMVPQARRELERLRGRVPGTA
jgi:tetratricopeptide (TPR) repeat protein